MFSRETLHVFSSNVLTEEAEDEAARFKKECTVLTDSVKATSSAR